MPIVKYNTILLSFQFSLHVIVPKVNLEKWREKSSNLFFVLKGEKGNNLILMDMPKKAFLVPAEKKIVTNVSCFFQGISQLCVDKSQVIVMYVCLEVALSGVLMERGVQLGL